MSTYLQLVQRLRQDCGVSGSGPTTVVSQTGQYKQLCDWINDAWMDIQSAHQDWEWLRVSLTPFTTTAAKQTYSPTADLSLTDFGMWARDSFRVYDTTAGINSETFLEYIPYDKWRDTYLFGALRSTTSRPNHVTITPDKSLGFGPITAAGYSIVGDYFKVPTTMSADTDTPSLPSHFHMAIVYRAMMFYGSYEVAPEVYQRGETEFTKMMRRMTLDRLSEPLMGGALA